MSGPTSRRASTSGAGGLAPETPLLSHSIAFNLLHIIQTICTIIYSQFIHTSTFPAGGMGSAPISFYGSTELTGIVFDSGTGHGRSHPFPASSRARLTIAKALGVNDVECPSSYINLRASSPCRMPNSSSALL